MDAEQRAIAKSQRTLDDLPAPVRKVGYQVQEHESIAELETAVEFLLVEGWRLEGGVSVTIFDGNPWYAQAMSLRSAPEA